MNVGRGGAAPSDARPTAEARAGAVVDLALAAGLWGGLYVVSAATFAAIPPITLNVLRLTVGVAVLAVAFRGDFGFGRSSGRRVLLAGVVVAITMALQFLGTSLTGGAEGAILTTTTPAFVLLFGRLLEGQRVRAAAWAGVMVALVGVAVIALRSTEVAAVTDLALDGAVLGPPNRVVGDLLLVGAAAAWALFSSVGRPLVAQVGAFRAILQASLVGVLLLVPFVPLELAGRTLPPLSGQTVLAILYLGVMSTAVAWSLWYRGYARAPAAVSAAAFFAQPIVGAILGVVVLHESLGPVFLAGAALVGAGILVVALSAGTGARPELAPED